MDKIKSRKLFVAILGALLPILMSYLTEAVDLDGAIRASSAVLVAYLASQGYADGQKERANGHE